MDVKFDGIRKCMNYVDFFKFHIAYSPDSGTKTKIMKLMVIGNLR